MTAATANVPGFKIPFRVGFTGAGDEDLSVALDDPGCGVEDLLQLDLASNLGVEDLLRAFQPSDWDEEEPRRGLNGEVGCGVEGLRRGFKPSGWGVDGLRLEAKGEHGLDGPSLSEDQSFPIADVSAVEM